MSIMILVFVVLGGMGNIRGSIIAATVLTLLPEVLREVADYRMLIYALALIIMMIFTSNDTLIAYRQRFFAWIKKFFAKGKKKKRRRLIMSMLKITNLGISFGGLRAVDDFNIEIEKGEALRPYRTQRRRKNHGFQPAHRRL